MECQGLTSSFATALKRTAIVVDRKPAIPILANVKIEAYEPTQIIKFTGTNSYLTAGCRMNSSVTVGGAVAVDQQRLYDLVSRLPQDKRLTLKLNADKLVMKCLGANYELAVTSADDLPSSPKPGKTERIEIQVAMLLRLLNVAGRAMLENDDRAHLSGIWFGWGDDIIFAMATDGMRLNRIEKPFVTKAKPGTVFIPHRAVHGMRRFAETLAEDVMMSITSSSSNLYFWVESAGFSSKMVESKMFDYQRTIPEKSLARADVSGPRLMEALLRLRIVSLDEPIRFFIDKGAEQLELTAASGVAAGKEMVKGKLKGGESEVVLSPAHVLEFVEAVGAREVRLSFSDARQAVLLKPSATTADEKVLGVVMPIQETKPS